MFLVGIRQKNLQLKTIELCFRQWIRSFVLDRILCSKHCEDWRQLISIAIDRHLTFFHRLKQSGLRLRWRAINFVSQKNVREYRTTSQVETGAADVEDVGAGDVGRHQIRRELNAAER